MNEHLLTAACIELLEDFLEDAYETGPAEDLPVQVAFAYRQARNIADIADDVRSLEADDRISSCFVLMRPLYESLMNLAAAAKNEAFAPEKMIAELDHDIGKLRKWQESDCISQPGFFSDTIDLLSDYADTLRSEHGVSTNRKWNTFEIARLAEFEHHYIREYFMYSRNAHASIGGIIAQERECGRELILYSTAYIVLSAVAHAVRVVPCRHAQVYVNQATRLLEFMNEERLKGDASLTEESD